MTQRPMIEYAGQRMPRIGPIWKEDILMDYQTRIPEEAFLGGQTDSVTLKRLPSSLDVYGFAR